MKKLREFVDKILSVFRKIDRYWWVLKRWFQTLPIIMDSCDFDYSSGVKLLNQHLERVAKFLESDRAFTINSKATAKKIRLYLELSKRSMEEYYIMDTSRILKEEYGLVREFDLEKVILGDKPYSQLVMKTIENPNGYTEDEIEEIEKKVYGDARAKQAKVDRLCWEYLGQNIHEFWD